MIAMGEKDVVFTRTHYGLAETDGRALRRIWSFAYREFPVSGEAGG